MSTKYVHISCVNQNSAIMKGWRYLIANKVKHLCWCFFAKNVHYFQALTIFTKKPYRRYLTDF